MKYEELREAIQQWKKHSGVIKIERTSLINSGFPGDFNLSFTEGTWLEEYGKFLDFNYDYNFSTIQSCIRMNDLGLLDDKNSWKYLGVFEMSDIIGSINLSKNGDYKLLQREQIKGLINLLNNFGINSDKIFPSYQKGGELKEITRGKYIFDFHVPEDNLSREIFLENGIPEKNLIPDKTRNTFLSLFIHRASPWGYRNEININVGSEEKLKLLDLATIQYLPWKPVFNSSEEAKNIIGLGERKDGASLGVIGLERLCMTINRLERVQDIDYLNKFYKKFRKLKGNENLLAGESLRALHRIYSDIESYKSVPGRHHKKKIRSLLQNISSLNEQEVSELLKVHTEAQPWHANLENGIKPTIERIKSYRLVR